MPTNRNEAVWSSGPRVHTGGGNDALVVIPIDQDLFDVTVIVAAATTAQVQVTHDSYEKILGINERPIRYALVAINDLGGSGELRMNAAAGQDFTDDGWAVGDTFEVVSHKSPTFGPEGTPPTTVADKQVYTVSSVAALVIGFTEDPAFSLAEGDIVVAQSRAAVAEDSLIWAQVGVDVVGAGNDHFNISTACAARVIASAGTGQIDYNFIGRMQSVVRPAPFVANVESRPYSGPPAGAQGIELLVDAAPVWAEDVVAGPNGSKRHGTATVAGTDFDVLGVKQYDKLNFSGHSVTGNTGVKAVRRVTGSKVQFYEPLDGVAGTDDPRIRIGQYVSASSGVVLSDYDELVLQILGGSASYLRMQDSPWPATLNPVLDSGPAGRTDWDESYTAGPNFEDGPMVGTTSPNGNFSRFNTSVGAASLGGASAQMTCGFWTIAREDAERDLVSKATDGDSSSDFSMRTQSIDDTVEAHWKGPLLADPGTWLANTAYVTGDRVRPSSDDNNVHECEVAGTSAVVSAGFQDGDYGGALTGGTATGLANDATVYTATVTVDGGADPISIVGSAAQTYTALISELDTDTTGGTWAINGGELRCTSSTTGETSTVSTVDTDLFATLTDFVSFNTAVPGDGEPTFASIGNTVVDGTVTWRHVSARIDFHDVTLKTAPIVQSPDNWDFLVCTRDSVGSFILYHQGVEVDRADVATADTVPGSFGTPVRAAFTVDYSQTEDATLHGLDGAFGPTNMPISFVIWDPTSAMTAAQVAALWDTAIDIGIVAVP